MKNITVLFLFCSSQLLSQNVELFVSGGYGFPVGGSALSAFNRTVDYRPTNGLIVTVRDAEDKYTSLSQGIRYEGKLNYYIEENIGIFLQIGYSSSDENAYKTVQEYGQGWEQLTTTKQNIDFSSYFISTGFHYRFSKWFVKPYCGVGAGIFFQNDIALREEFKYGGSIHRIIEQKLTVNNPIGYVGFIGASVPVTPAISIFAEIKSTMLTYYAERVEIVKYIYNGEERIQTLAVKDRIIVYEPNHNFTRTSLGDDDQPTNGGPPYAQPGSNVSIIGGISFTL